MENGAYLDDNGKFIVLTDHYEIHQRLIDFLTEHSAQEFCRSIITRWQQAVLAEHMSPLQKECALKELDDIYGEYYETIEALIEEEKQS